MPQGGLLTANLASLSSMYDQVGCSQKRLFEKSLSLPMRETTITDANALSKEKFEKYVIIIIDIRYWHSKGERYRKLKY